MLSFAEIFPEIVNDPAKFKVHLATGISNNDPIQAFFKGKFKEWQEWQTKRNFERDFIISFIYYQPSEWLFAGVYKKISSVWNIDHWDYDTELLEIRKDLIGRLVINYEKPFRASYLKFEKYYQSFLISEILKERLAVKPFPGYDKVHIHYEDLQTIILKNEKTWKTALQNVKGIYLISDDSNGKLYVGSAYGDNAFWTRWEQYCNNGHGGNIELRKLIEKEGINHTKKFHFSILEVRSPLTDDNIIIERENYWKDILKTRDHGYNKN